MLYPTLLILSHTAAGGGSAAERQRAAADCFAWVHRRSQRSLRTRGGSRILIPPVPREDIAQEVLLSILANPGRIVAVVLRHDKFREAGLDDVARVTAAGPALEGLLEEASELCGAYVDKMLVNRWLDEIRRNERLTYPGEEIGQGSEGLSPPDSVIERSLATLQRAMDAHLAGVKRDELRAQHEESWTQIVGLTMGRVSMDDLIAATIESDPSLKGEGAEADKRARDRLLQRHHRVRGYLQKAIDQLEALGPDAGGMSAGDASVARTAAQVLLVRCQKKP